MNADTPITDGSTHHTFSFADYHDPKHMGFRALRVINDDRVAPGRGFGTHPHRDMEILSYVLEGALEHKDTMGTGSVIRPGDVQRMSAGTGVRHSEFNASKPRGRPFPADLDPAGGGRVPPSYEQKYFGSADKEGRLRLVASPDGAEGSVRSTRTPAYTRAFRAGQTASWRSHHRHAWVHVASGRARVAGHELGAGDALGLSGEESIAVQGLDKGDDAEVLVFDLA